MLGRKLRDFIVEVKPKECVLLCHHNADPDSIGSAYALSKLLSRLLPDSGLSVVASESVSSLSKRLIE
ncbi:MAG: bifunctional oligoribonuclease/PAP phosphatase NrnA, partial [Candidatus Methanomethylicota archaeon]